MKEEAALQNAKLLFFSQIYPRDGRQLCDEDTDEIGCLLIVLIRLFSSDKLITSDLSENSDTLSQAVTAANAGRMGCTRDRGDARA